MKFYPTEVVQWKLFHLNLTSILGRTSGTVFPVNLNKEKIEKSFKENELIMKATSAPESSNVQIYFRILPIKAQNAESGDICSW